MRGKLGTPNTYTKPVISCLDKGTSIRRGRTCDRILQVTLIQICIGMKTFWLHSMPFTTILRRVWRYHMIIRIRKSICKTLHRKPKIEQHESRPPQKTGGIWGKHSWTAMVYNSTYIKKTSNHPSHLIIERDVENAGSYLEHE